MSNFTVFGLPQAAGEPYNTVNSTTAAATTAVDCCVSMFHEILAAEQPVSNETSRWENEQIERFCGNNRHRWTPDMCRAYHFGPEITSVTSPLYGYVSPFLSLVTLIVNTLVCVVLCKKNMRTSTNIVLAAMATADLLTGVCPTPMFVYVHTLGYARDWPSCSVVQLYNVFSIYLPTIFHTASIWLTVMLAAQRYIVMRGTVPQQTNGCVTVNKIIVCIVVIYALAFASQTTTFIDYRYEPTTLPSLLQRGHMTSGCLQVRTLLTSTNEDLYFTIYWTSRTLLVHVIPCVALVTFTWFLVMTIRASNQRRRQNCNVCPGSAQENDAKRTNMMLVAVVVIFLAVELPLAAIYVHVVLEGLNIIGDDITIHHTNAFAITNNFILLSYNVNFIIYCAMSRQFRQTFLAVFNTHSDEDDDVRPAGRRGRCTSMTTDGNGRPTTVNETTTMV